MRARKVDHNAIKFNQVSIAGIVMVAFGFDIRWLIGLLALLLLVSVVRPQWGAFRLIYERIVLPRRWLRPNVLPDDPAPHRFAQGVGAAFLVISEVALAVGATWLGWGLAWLVAILALVNVLFDFCAGCFGYYQLRRFGLIGRIPQAD